MSHKPLMEVFLEQVEAWTGAMRLRRHEEARRTAKQIETTIELLAIDPQFKRIFERHDQTCHSDDPEQVIGCFRTLVRAITEAAEPGSFRGALRPAGPNAA